MSNEALLQAIGIIGSRKKLATKLHISVHRLDRWLNQEIAVPLEYARIIELITHGAVTCEQLSPKGIARIPKEFKNQFFDRSISNSTPHKFLAAEDQFYDFADKNRVNQFSISEKAKLGLDIEAKIKHQGHRSDLKGQLRKNFCEVPGRSDAFVAKRLGFGNETTYRQVKTVCNKGCMELINAMDKRAVVVSVAAAIALLPHDEQRKILAMSKKEITVLVKQLNEAKKHSR